MIHRAAVFAGVVATFVCVAGAPASSETIEERATYTFVAADAPKTGLPEERLQVTIDRWSSDDERDRLASLLAANDTQSLRYALRNAEAAGHLRWPGGLEYTLRYARRTERADGGADLVLIADSRVWVWWDSTNDLALDEPFTVFHVRLDRNGVGEGRVAPASRVRPDERAGVAVTDLDTRPALMTDVRPRRG
jgi:hypothetical protein